VFLYSWKCTFPIFKGFWRPKRGFWSTRKSQQKFRSTAHCASQSRERGGCSTRSASSPHHKKHSKRIVVKYAFIRGHISTWQTCRPKTSPAGKSVLGRPSGSWVFKQLSEGPQQIIDQLPTHPQNPHSFVELDEQLASPLLPKRCRNW
jgi:hypothetical protein